MPKYKTRAEQHLPVMGQHIKVISEWLEQDKKAPKKQRHTARRIYDRLVAEQFYGCAVNRAAHGGHSKGYSIRGLHTTGR